jgi:plasmid replication initiation protein
MSDELATANTPETLGVTPRYVLQHNAISRSAHAMSATAKKLTVMAMALLPADLSTLTAAFTFTDFCKAIGYGDGGEQYRLFTKAVDECLKTVISIETGKVIKGKKSWEKFTWFEHAKFNAETGVCAMRFSKELADFLREFKKVYAKISLSDVGRLQSKYALRLFEMAKSYESLAGKDGNPSDTWYFERTVEDMRLILGISADTYTETKRFRQKVIEAPVKEINEAGIGVEIKTEGVKRGHRLAAIRLNCKKAPHTTKKKRGRPKKATEGQPELPYEYLRDARNREDKEREQLKELYPDEFAELYVSKLKEYPVFAGGVGDSFRKTAAERSALEALWERHGIVK